MDSLWRLKQAIFYRARPIEGSERSCSVHGPHGYKHPQLCHIFVLSIVAPPAHPIRHKSELHPYHPQEENRLAQHGLSQASEMHWNDKYNDSLDVQSQTIHAKTSRMKVALAKLVPAASHDLAIISEKNCVEVSRRYLDVWNSFIHGWNATLSVIIWAASNGLAITSEKHCVIHSCRNLAVRESFIQMWNSTSFIWIAPESNGLAITSEKHRIAVSADTSTRGVQHCP